MTVHGAKGLEAPIVVVIDGCEVLGKDPPLIGVPVDRRVVGSRLVALQGPRSARRRGGARGAAGQGQEEHNRLLYVAMTRAKDRLVIAPYRTGSKAPDEAWCEMVRRASSPRPAGPS